MSAIATFARALASGDIDVIDLTAPLTSQTPILKLPEPFANTVPFTLQEVSRYDDRGPAWYWNNIHTGEHTGTHFDAPVHWVTGAEGRDVSQVPATELVAPGVVLDFSTQSTADPDFLLTIEDVRAWEATHGPLPNGGWLMLRTGWDAYAHDAERYLNTDDTGSHTPGISAECARWLAAETDILGIGVETVGTDAGMAAGFTPPFPCHALLLGAGKYGLTQLQNLERLPATGALIITAPLPIVGGSGSPARVLALVDRAS